MTYSQGVQVDRVDLSPVSKILSRLPIHIVSKLMRWVEGVESDGLEEMRRIPGYHDEPLKGQRIGKRSIRLSRAYRAIYSTHLDGSIRVILIAEVNKHEY